jgi:hypothetical protein
VKRLIAVSLFTPCHPKNMMQQQQISKETPNKRQLQPSFKIKKQNQSHIKKLAKQQKSTCSLGMSTDAGSTPGFGDVQCVGSPAHQNLPKIRKAPNTVDLLPGNYGRCNSAIHSFQFQISRS